MRRVPPDTSPVDGSPNWLCNIQSRDHFLDAVNVPAVSRRHRTQNLKKTKLEKQFKESIKKGDKVVTIGGVHGKIIEVQEKTFILEIADDIKVKIEKSAISADVTKQYAPTAEVKK